jgi:hypothetical protein
MIAKPENNLKGFKLVESSEAGMLTQAEKAIKKGYWRKTMAAGPNGHPATIRPLLVFLLRDLRFRCLLEQLQGVLR